MHTGFLGLSLPHEVTVMLMDVLILEDALFVWTNCLPLLRRTTENSSSRRIMHLVSVFILETNDQTNNKCLPKFVQTDNASSRIKTANEPCLLQGR